MHKLLFLALFLAAPALPAAEAVVKVVVGQASAKPNTSLAAGSTFSTGKKSRSELAVGSATVRTGSDTSVQIVDQDTVNLTKGITLVASKPKLFRSSVHVNAPGYGMNVRGTAQIYYDPGHSIRVVVLEGSLTIALHSVRGETVTLKRGQELIINPVDHQLPVPVEVDLNRLMTTMTLLHQRDFPALPSSEHIVSCAQRQEQELVQGEELTGTSLVMGGAAPELDLRTEELVHEEVQDELDDLDGDGEPDPAILVDEDGNPIEDPNADSTTADGTDTTADESTDEERRVRRRSAKSAATTKATTITLSNQSVSDNQVRMGAATGRTRIQISNSSEVAALAGALQMLGRGGSIQVDGSTLRAASEILLDTSSTEGGLISLKDSLLNANAIRARAFANAGDALIIDGSTLNANQLIKLYAEGSSTLRFRNHVTLNTNQAIIAGKTVEVDAGGAVDVRGRADIYTDNANFNKAGYGTISAGGGVITRPHAGRPGF